MGTCASGDEPPGGGSGGQAPTPSKPGKSAGAVGKEIATYAGMYGVAIAKGTLQGVGGWFAAGRKWWRGRGKKSPQKLSVVAPVAAKPAPAPTPAPVITPPEPVVVVTAPVAVNMDKDETEIVMQPVETAVDADADSVSTETKERKKAPARRGIKLKTDI